MNEKELQFRKVLGFNIKVERARKNITQETLAEMAGISTNFSSNVLHAPPIEPPIVSYMLDTKAEPEPSVCP